MTTNNEMTTTYGKTRRNNDLLIDLWYDGDYNPEDRPRFEEYLFSEEGRKELVRLNETDVVELWDLVLIIDADYDPSLDLFYGAEGPWKFSRAVAERIMECIPDSLILRDTRPGRYVDRRMFIERLWNIVLTDNESVQAPDDLQCILRTIDLNPGGIIDRQPDSMGNLLLHISMKFFSYRAMSINVLRRMHDAFPDAIRHKNKEGCLPLHMICKELELLTEGNFQCVKYILSQYPFAAGIIDENGFLPFHYLIKGSVNWTNFNHEIGEDVAFDLIDKVYSAYPKAVNVRLNSESILHFVCKLDMSNLIDTPIAIYFLLKKIPQAMFETDKKGYTPLECFNDYWPQSQFIDGIEKGSLGLKRHLESTHDNFSQDNILHIFSRVHCLAHGSNRPTKNNKISNRTTRDNTLYLKLIKNFPSLTMEQNLYGDVPLHVRLRSGDETNSLFTDIQALVKAMDAAQDSCCDNKPNVLAEVHIGMVPFMMAASRQEPCVSTILFLLQRFIAEHGTLFDIFSEPEQKRERKRQRLTEQFHCNY